MAQSFSGSRFLVTGAARGVGLAVCQSARAAGAHVVGVDINDIPGGVADICLKGDLGDAEFCKRIIAEAGHVDVLVNAAGLLRPQNFLEMTVDDFDKAVAVNLRSVFQLCQGVIPSMLDKGKGRIINFSSVVARTGGTTSGAYAAAKAGIIGMTRALAKELGPEIAINCICPGVIQTELGNSLTRSRGAEMVKGIALGRLGTPADVAQLVAFLATVEPNFMSGQDFKIDGYQWVT